jgi:hypothetical protein
MFSRKSKVSLRDAVKRGEVYRQKIIDAAKLLTRHSFTCTEEGDFKSLATSLYVYVHIMKDMKIPCHDVLSEYTNGSVAVCISLLIRIVSNYSPIYDIEESINEIFGIFGVNI